MNRTCHQLHWISRLRLGLALCVAVLITFLTGTVQATPPGTGWTMTYDKEFTTLPTFAQTVGSKTPGWLPCPYWNERWSADAKQYCCFPGIDTGYMPFSIGSGEGLSVLNITANPTPVGMSAGGRSWVSGQLTTAAGAPYSTDVQSSTPFGQKYGYFEARCKLPTAAGTTKGMWPAFWLMPADGSSVTEYDIFEVLGNAPTQIHQSSHWNTYGNGSGNDYIGPDTSSGFHTYGFQWDSIAVRWYVDGVLTQIAPNYINKAMYPLFTLSVGGSWPGNPDATTVFPGIMQVEYLRVYSGGTVPTGGTVADGTYNLACQTSGMALDNAGSITSGSNIVQATANTSSASQRWNVTYLNNGYYKVINAASGLSLDNGGATTNGALIHQATYTGSLNQQWAIGNGGTGYFNLVCATSGMALDNTGSHVSGANMTQYTIQGGNNNQLWSFTNAQALPNNADVGTGGLVGSTSYASGVYTVNGSGWDIWTTGDKFQYAYQTKTGDCSITARVASQSNSNMWAKSGVMIRGDLTAGAANMLMALTPGQNQDIQWRTTAGGSSSSVYPGVAGNAPYWVRVTRVGNVFTGYASVDGVTWVQRGTPQTITMGSTVYVGLAVCSHDTTLMCTSTFDNVTVTP